MILHDVRIKKDMKKWLLIKKQNHKHVDQSKKMKFLIETVWQ